MNSNQVKVASGISFLFGLWLIISPFLLGFSTSATAMWDAIIVGVIVAILSAIRFFTPASGTGLSWINAVLGLWMIISPFVLALSGVMGVMWDFIIVGIAFIIFNVWAAVTHPVTTA